MISYRDFAPRANCLDQRGHLFASRRAAHGLIGDCGTAERSIEHSNDDVYMQGT